MGWIATRAWDRVAWISITVNNYYLLVLFERAGRKSKGLKELGEC
jgi:hypothetical protein